MRNLLKEMAVAINAKAYYPALMTAVTIPDICAALNTNGTTKKAKYVKWFNEYAAHRFEGLMDGMLAYSLRSSVLHQGTLKAASESYNQFMIVTDNKAFGMNHISIRKGGSGYFVLELNQFCYNIGKSVLDWLKQVENTKNYQNNYRAFFKKEKLETPWSDEVEIIAVF